MSSKADSEDQNIQENFTTIRNSNHKQNMKNVVMKKYLFEILGDRFKLK